MPTTLRIRSQVRPRLRAGSWAGDRPFVRRPTLPCTPSSAACGGRAEIRLSTQDLLHCLRLCERQAAHPKALGTRIRQPGTETANRATLEKKQECENESELRSPIEQFVHDAVRFQTAECFTLLPALHHALRVDRPRGCRVTRQVALHPECRRCHGAGEISNVDLGE